MEAFVFRNFLKKIPGLGNENRLKKVIASIFYSLLFLVVLAIIIPTPLTFALDDASPTNQTGSFISGKTISGSLVSVLRDGQIIAKVEADSGGRFRIEIGELIEGENEFTVKVCREEEQKHCTEGGAVLIVDQTPPLPPTIDSFPEETNQKKITIRGWGEKESNVRIFVNNEETTVVEVDPNGLFEAKISLSEGENEIKAKALDEAGNQSVFSEEVFIKCTPPPEPSPEVKGETASSETEEAWVTRVIDGDTIEIEGGQKVRYIGIDTPETVHPSKPVECFGKEASSKNSELVGGKKITLEKDISETDKYGRLLRYIWVGDILLNDYLVRQGYARASSYPPDIKYQEQFRQAEQEARGAERGLWAAGACDEDEAPAVEDKNCSDFATQEEAQAFFISQGGPEKDPHRLDGDSDGTACESLPSSSPSPATPEPEPTPESEPEDGGKDYTCDCSKTCSKMSSCEEAYYQLNTCGCSKRDGDGDGVPCENICD